MQIFIFIIETEGVPMGGAGVQIVETRSFWEILWWKHLHMKNMQKTMEKNQTHVPSQASPQTLPMGLSFLFFLFFLVFSRFWPNYKKLWKNQKNQKNKKFRPISPARPLPRPCPWVWTFCFFLFFWFSRGFGQIVKNHGKTKKKSLDPCPQPGLSPDLAHGSELFGFFCFLEVLAKL